MQIAAASPGRFAKKQLGSLYKAVKLEYHGRLICALYLRLGLRQHLGSSV